MFGGKVNTVRFALHDTDDGDSNYSLVYIIIKYHRL